MPAACAAALALSSSVGCLAAMRDAREPDTGGIARAAAQAAGEGGGVYHTSPQLLIPVWVQSPGLRHLLLSDRLPPPHLGSCHITEANLAASVPPEARSAALVVGVPHRSWEAPVDAEAEARRLAPRHRIATRAVLRGAEVFRLEPER